MKTLLALETSTRACSVALWHAGDVLVKEEMTPQAHARRLLAMVDTLLSEAGVAPEAVDALVFGRGPGAFTGLRIATAVVQGLALGWDRPVAGVSGLEAMAWWFSRRHSGPVAAALDARMGECYAAISEGGRLVMSASLMGPDRLLEQMSAYGVVMGVGDAVCAFPMLGERVHAWEDALPSARYLVEMAVSERVDFSPVDKRVPVPLYLRNQVADKPGRRSR